MRNGKWVGRWREDAIQTDGTVTRIHRKQVLGTKQEFKTKREAQRELDLRLAPINSLNYRPTFEITFGQFARKWMDEVMPLAYKVSTRDTVQRQVQHKLLTAFSESSLKDITTSVLQSYVSALERRGLSGKYVRNLVSTMSAMWRTALAWKYVSHDTFEGVVLPQVGRSESRVYSQEEAVRILRAAREPLRTFLLIAAETGMRPGEVCGLDWKNINLGDGLISVRQSTWHGRIVAPKTTAGIRDFAISPQLVEHLRPMAKREGLLFQCKNGRAWKEDKVRQKKLYPLLDVLRIERKGLHAFRHFNATFMDRQNIPLKTRQERLGHSDPRLTLGVRNRSGYTHRVSEDDRKAAESLGAVLYPDVPKQDGSSSLAG
jgi:integrase